MADLSAHPVMLAVSECRVGVHILGILDSQEVGSQRVAVVHGVGVGHPGGKGSENKLIVPQSLSNNNHVLVFTHLKQTVLPSVQSDPPGQAEK